MYHHVRQLKGATTDRLHDYCCVKYPSYAAWHEHPFHAHTHWFIFAVFFVGWVMGLFFQLHFFPLQFAGAASYSWNQASWVGGATANNANHTSDQTGWTQYNAKDTNLTDGATLTLTQQSTTFSENFSATTYKDASATTADWQTANSRVQLDKTFFGSATTVALSPAGASAAVTAVDVSGSYAYIAVLNTTTTDLMIVDLNNTSNVYTLDLNTSTRARDIKVVDNYAYIITDTSGGSLYIVDVTDPTSPSIAGSESLTNGGIGVDVSGNYAYIAADAQGLAVIDISNKTNPEAPVYLDTTAAGCAASVVVNGSYAYVSAGRLNCTGSALEVFDISTPTSPTNVASKTFTGTTRGQMAFANNTIYIAGGDVVSINVTDPANPGNPTYVAVDDITRGMTVSGSYLYVADDDDSVDIYSIATPTSPSLVAEGLANADDVVVSGGSVYTVGGSPDDLRFATTDPVNYNTPRIAQSIAVDTATDSIALATLTATRPEADVQTITYQLSNDGGTTWNTVTSGDEYTFSTTGSDLRWKATLSATDTAQTPTLSSISINYKYYPASQVFTSSQFNTEASTTQVTQIAWSETSPVPTGTNVRLQIRTAPDSGGSPGTWSDWLGPTSATDYYETTPAGETVNSINSSDNDDQWIQYRAYLTSTGLNTQTLSNVTISYSTYPASPTLSSTTHASQTTFYSSATPSITITAGTPTPVHYHYLVNQTANADMTIGAVAAGTSTDGSFIVPSSPGDNTITSDGTWYVHVVAHDSAHTNSANFASYTIKRDATAPTSTTLSFGNITASSITASASASDATAGLHATPFYFERDSGVANSGWITGDWTDSGLSANTQYAYRVESRDVVPNTSAFTANQSKYTAANTPSASSITTPTATTLKVIVNKNGNPTGPAPAGDTQYAIAISTDNFASDTRYVQTDGSIGAAALWGTYSQWGSASGTTVTGLTANTTYSFKVKARNGDNLETSYSSLSSGYTAANAPANFRSLGGGASSVSLAVDRFDADTLGQAGYYFSRTGVNSGWIGTNTWNDTSVSPNTTYTYSVKTRDSNGVESGTSTLQVTTLALAPDRPTIDDTIATETSLQLALAASTNPSTTTYAIQETTQNKYVQDTSAALDTTVVWKTLSAWGTITVSGLTAGTTYSFKIKARNSEESETAYSSSTSSSTLTAPSAPSIDASGTTQDSLRLMPTGNANPSSTTYAIQETTTSQYVQTGGALGATTVWKTLSDWGSVTVSSLTPNTTYTFRMKAQNRLLVETGFGATVAATTLAPGVPRAPTFSGRSATTISVAIDTTGLGAALEYALFETTTNQYVLVTQGVATLGNTSTWQTYTNWGSASGTSVTGLTAQTTYIFKVKSRDPNAGSVESAFGPTASTSTTRGSTAPDTTPPTLPTDIAIVATGRGTVRLSWTDPADFARALIFRADGNATPGGAPIATVERGVGFFIDTTVRPITAYTYQIRFEDGDGNGVISALLSITTLDTPPTPPTSAQGELHVRELIRVQHPPRTGDAGNDACTSGQLWCSMNRLFTIERTGGLDFLVDRFVPERERQETFRIQERAAGSGFTIIGRFGLFYDLLPKGNAAGDTLAAAVAITLRYNPRDADRILRPEHSLALVYLNARTNTWELVMRAEQDAVNGIFTARVSKVGTYGIVILKETRRAI